jgi:hypothetical protein
MLSLCKPGSLIDVNTSMPPEQTAAKCAPGRATVGDQAALLTRKIPLVPWRLGSRIEAARILARIHMQSEGELSEHVRHLARIPDPRE